MSVDGEVLADLRRLLRSCRDGAAAVEPLPTRLLLITGPRGMGKTTALTSILQSLQHIDATTTAEEYVMVADLASVCEPTSDNVAVSSPNKMSSSAVALLPISYMSVQEELHRPHSPLAGTADLRFSVPVIGVVDDVDLVWRLCAMNRVLPALRRLLHPLLRRPPSSTSVAGKVERDGLLLITAMDAGSVPRELLDASPPLCYALPAGLTAPAARRLTRGLPSTSQTLRDWADAAATAMEGDVRAQGAERSPPSRRLLMMGLCLADDAKKNANTEPNEMKSSRDDERRLASCLSWLSSAAVGMAPSANKLHRPASTLYGLDDLAERLRLMVSIFIAQHQHNTTSKSGGRPSGTLSATVPCTTGVLLYGPSGCGKTALLRWLSSEAFPHISFFMVSCTSLFGKYLGESEERLRAIYRDARSRAPSVVVLDEMDVVAASRGEMQGSSGSTSGGVDVVKRMLAALLCELDGVADNRGVLTIGTTNTPRSMDQAVLRQGRLETLLPVPPLTREAAELMAWRCFSQFARHPSHDDDDDDDDDGDGTTACEEEARRLSSLIASRAVGCAPVSLAYTLRKVVERSLGDEDEPSHTTADTSSANNHKANCVIPALPSQRVVDSVLFECTSVLIPTHVEILS